jgi:hypothetical protein
VTRVVRNAQEVDVSNLATKTDLQLGLAEVKAEIAGVRGEVVGVKAEVAVVRAELERHLAELKSELLKWLVGSLGLQTVAVIGAVIALVRSVSH